MNMKVALICCGRLENRYAVEFVDYYKKLGFDHIFIADNNRDDEEHFEDVLQSYIDDNFVTIYNWRNGIAIQYECYKEIYSLISNDYDWVAFFDFDEFLTLVKDKNIKDYLSRECFKNANQILINWKIYTDNNLIYDDGRPCLERFTKSMSKYKYIKYQGVSENKHVKHLLKTKLTNINITIHNSSQDILDKTTYNNVGKKILKLGACQKINYELAYIKHFTTKTIDEYIHNKCIKGTCDGNNNHIINNNPLEYFFKYNKITKKKLKYLKNNNIDITNINKNYINNLWIA